MQIDCVDIVSSSLNHYELATIALRNSKHIFLETPITHTIDEAKSLINLSREASVKIQVGSTNRFNPAFITSLESISKPKSIDSQNHLQFNAESSEISLVMDLMMSDIDIVLSVVKSGIRKVSANGTSVFSKENDIIHAKIEFDNGCVANLCASRLAKTYKNETTFYQNEKCIHVNFLTNDIEEIKLDQINDDNLNTKITILPEIIELNPIKNELNSFYTVIKNDSEPIVSLNDGYNSLKVAYQILDLLNQSKVVLVDNIF